MRLRKIEKIGVDKCTLHTVHLVMERMSVAKEPTMKFLKMIWEVLTEKRSWFDEVEEDARERGQL